MTNLPISEDIFGRLTCIREYDNNQDGGNNVADSASLINEHQPHILTDFNLNWHLPKDHLATQIYRDAMTVPTNQIPFFTTPAIGTIFPIGDPNYIPHPHPTPH